MTQVNVEVFDLLPLFQTVDVELIPGDNEPPGEDDGKLPFNLPPTDWTDYAGNFQTPMLGLAPLYSKPGTGLPQVAHFNPLVGLPIYFVIWSEDLEDYTIGASVTEYRNYRIQTKVPDDNAGMIPFLSVVNGGLDVTRPDRIPSQTISTRFCPNNLQIPGIDYPQINDKWLLKFANELPEDGEFSWSISGTPIISVPTLRNAMPPLINATITFAYDATIADIQAEFDTIIGANNALVSGIDLLHQQNLYKDEDGNITYTPTGDVVGVLNDGAIIVEFLEDYGGIMLTSSLQTFNQGRTSIQVLLTATRIQRGSKEIDITGQQFQGLSYISNDGSTNIPFTSIPEWFQKQFDHLDVRVFSNYIRWLQDLSDWHGWGYNIQFELFKGDNPSIIIDEFEGYSSLDDYQANGYPINFKNLFKQLRDFIQKVCNEQFGTDVANCPIWAPSGGMYLGSNDPRPPNFPRQGWIPVRGDWNFTPNNIEDVGKCGKYSVDDFTSMLPYAKLGPTTIDDVKNIQTYPFYKISKTTYKTVIKPLYTQYTYGWKLDCSGVDFSQMTHFLVSNDPTNTYRPISQFGVSAFVTVFANCPVIGTLDGSFSGGILILNFMPPAIGMGVTFGVLSGGIFSPRAASLNTPLTQSTLPQNDYGYYMPLDYLRAPNPPVLVAFEKQLIYKITNSAGQWAYLLGGVRSSPQWSNTITAASLNSMLSEVLGMHLDNFQVTYWTTQYTVTNTDSYMEFPFTSVTGGCTFSEEFFDVSGQSIVYADAPLPNVIYTGPRLDENNGTFIVNPMVTWNGAVNQSIRPVPLVYPIRLVQEPGNLVSVIPMTLVAPPDPAPLDPNTGQVVTTFTGPVYFSYATVPFNGSNGVYGIPDISNNGINVNVTSNDEGGPGNFLQIRQDIGNISTDDILAAPEASIYTATLTNSTQPVDRISSGFVITDNANSVSTIGFGGLKVFTGSYKKEARAYCIDTRGKSLRQYLGLNILTTMISNIIIDGSTYCFNNDLGFLWSDTETTNIVPGTNAWPRNNTYQGGLLSWQRSFNGIIKISYGTVEGRLLIPTGVTELNDYNLWYVKQPDPVIGTSYILSMLPTSLDFENAHMIDAMNGTTLCEFVVNQTFLEPNHAVPVILSDTLMNNIEALADIVPNVDSVTFIKVEISMTPTGLKNITDFKDNQGATKYGPNPSITMTDGFSTSGIGQSSNSINNTVRKFSWGDIELDVSNRIYQ